MLGTPSPAIAAASHTVASGVTYRSFTTKTDHGTVVGHLLTVDLRKAKLNLLHPGAVAARGDVRRMVRDRGALAGVNGDFFHISEHHKGLKATGSSVGPAIASGRALKGAVPTGQTFGPRPPAGGSVWDVFGVGYDRRAHVSRVAIAGEVSTSEGDLDIDGLNQYALPVDGIGVFTKDWGSASRVRATCGSDTRLTSPCSTHTEEVVVRDGVVVAERDTPGSGAIPSDTVVLVGREDGADALEALDPGDRAVVHYRLESDSAPALWFAVGGIRILEGESPVAGLDDHALAPRTAAGASADGRTVYLVVVDGRSRRSAGMTIADLARLMRTLGAVDAVNLDGGGSSTLVAREPASGRVAVKNTPSDGHPRAVANGIGVFPRR